MLQFDQAPHSTFTLIPLYPRIVVPCTLFFSFPLNLRFPSQLFTWPSPSWRNGILIATKVVKTIQNLVDFIITQTLNYWQGCLSEFLENYNQCKHGFLDTQKFDLWTRGQRLNPIVKLRLTQNIWDVHIPHERELMIKNIENWKSNLGRPNQQC